MYKNAKQAVTICHIYKHFLRAIFYFYFYSSSAILLVKSKFNFHVHIFYLFVRSYAFCRCLYVFRLLFFHFILFACSFYSFILYTISLSFYIRGIYKHKAQTSLPNGKSFFFGIYFFKRRIYFFFLFLNKGLLCSE